MNVWHLAAFGSERDIMQKIWDLAVKILTREEMKIICYLPQTNGEIMYGRRQHRTIH